jgi:hypothetical protein
MLGPLTMSFEIIYMQNLGLGYFITNEILFNVEIRCIVAI